MVAHYSSIPAEKRKRLFYGMAGLCLVVLVTLGVFAKNGWLPSTDPFSGKKTGWFGSGGNASVNERVSVNSNAPDPALPTGTPQLSKEYIYAGSRLLAV